MAHLPHLPYPVRKSAAALGTICVLLWAFPPGSNPAPDRLVVGDFSSAAVSDTIPSHWEELIFAKIKKHTHYRVVMDEGIPVVRADAAASASGIIQRIQIDPGEYPILKWRWKVTNVYAKGDATRKSGDDYPARLYITFEYDPDTLGFAERAKYRIAGFLYGREPPLAALNYIWASRTQTGRFLPNPYSDRSMMVVLRNGRGPLNTWVEEERNVLEDYRRAFGGEPPMISGVAIMTDSDNTGEKATAYYGDIVFSKE